MAVGELLFMSMEVGMRFVGAEVPNEVVVFSNPIRIVLLIPWLPNGTRPCVGTRAPG